MNGTKTDLPKSFFEWPEAAVTECPNGAALVDTPDVLIEIGQPVFHAESGKYLLSYVHVYSHFPERVAAALLDVGGRRVEG